MDNLVIILDNIFHAYEHASYGGLHNDVSNDEDDQSHGTIGSSNVINLGNDLTSDDRWFIFCARPRGSVTLIPTFLAISGGKGFYCWVHVCILSSVTCIKMILLFVNISLFFCHREQSLLIFLA